MDEKSELQLLYNRFPKIENFKGQIEEKGKNFPFENRQILVSALEKQHENLEISDITSQNIQLLKLSNTYTITTGHQLNLFTGPLYFFFKITSTMTDTKILNIKRLRLVDGNPLIYEDTYLPVNRFQNFDVDLLNFTPMYTIFKEQYGVTFEKATESFSALIVENKEILKHLGYQRKSSCMLIKRITYERGEIIEYTVSYARGDKYEYKVTLNNI